MGNVEIAGSRPQTGTEREIYSRIKAELGGTKAHWSAEIILENGKWHPLEGGTVQDADQGTFIPAVNEAFDAEVAALDLDALNKRPEN